MPGKHFLIVIGGPTASGKTELAIRLATDLGTEILSADSRQFYREMRIGTARPDEAQLAAVPHHFIGHLSVADSYSVGDYERDALALLDKLFEQRQAVILTGGSGLYIKALCEGLDEFPEVPAEVLEGVKNLYAEQGIEALQRELQSIDPAYYATVDLQNPHRLIRAIAVYRASGKPFSSFRTLQTVERPFTPIYIWLDRPREALYQRINRRVDEMLEQGLLDEARQLYPLRHFNALQTVGYQELFDYFEGKLTLDAAVDLIKQNSRRYAKRQLTWMRRDGHWTTFSPGQWEEITAFVAAKMLE